MNVRFPVDVPSASRPRRRAWKLVVLAPAGAAALLLLAEFAARELHLGAPSYSNWGLPEERWGLVVPDRDLFWKLVPGFRGTVDGVEVRINALGLRGPEVDAKAPGELRVLSLGESTTYGIGVRDTETYSAVLERGLDRALRARAGRRCRVVDAGVFAYSSFQSLKYLELRGLSLEPDLVLFYHEVNDYLPSTVRDSSDNEIGARMSDRELHASRKHAAGRFLMQHSALYRWIRFQRAAREIRKFAGVKPRNPVTRIGLDERQHVPGRLSEARGVDEASLGCRVTEEERVEIFRELLALSRASGFRVVLIHPAYRESERHACVLTRFAAETGADLFEAFDSLHPEGAPRDAMFLDSWHPNQAGHRRLGEHLTRYVLDRVPAALAGW